MKYSIDVIKDLNGRHYWELLGPNRKRMARSKNYGCKSACHTTAKKLLADLNRKFADIRFIDMNEGEE